MLAFSAVVGVTEACRAAAGGRRSRRSRKLEFLPARLGRLAAGDQGRASRALERGALSGIGAGGGRLQTDTFKSGRTMPMTLRMTTSFRATRVRITAQQVPARRDRGLTLIELMVGLSVLAIAMALSAPQFGQSLMPAAKSSSCGEAIHFVHAVS